jgi:hypothetical protein
MSPYLRLERRNTTSWSLADGRTSVGRLDAGGLILNGFPDAPSAQVAADVATGVVRRWHERRTADSPAATVHVLNDEHGFACTVPDDAWLATRLELAQRLHVATLSLRNPFPEPAA